MSVVAFPALLPSSRVHTAGAFPTALYRSAAGFRAQTRVGIGSHGHEVSLSFDNLPMASAALIRSHWANAGGTAETFDLPAVVWSAGQFGVPLVAGLQWRYAAQPEFRDEECERQSVSVRLVAALLYKSIPPLRVMDPLVALIVEPALGDRKSVV
jgi:hypothetical protein